MKPQQKSPEWLMLCVISLMMVSTAAITTLMMQDNGRRGEREDYAKNAPDLETLFPDNFDEWQRVYLSDTVLPSEVNAQPGEAVTYRAYRNKLGRVITLLVAYGPPASDSVRLHRPETCYVAQGFAIDWRKSSSLNLSNNLNYSPIPINRLMTQNSLRFEAVSYWLRAGQGYATSAAAHQWINLQQGLGKTADGVLVRISSNGKSDQEFNLHTEFMESLLYHMAPEKRSLLIVQSV